MSENICFICNEDLEGAPTRTVKHKGIETLHKAAEKRARRDHLHILAGKDKITVHSTCQKKYCNEAMIAAHIRRVSSGIDDSVHQPSTSTGRPALRSAVKCFHFEGHCCLCGEEITADFLEKEKKTPLAKRNTVHMVEMHSVRDTFLNAAQKRGDEWGLNIVERISPDLDLVAAEAQYHHFCQRKLFHMPSEFKKGYRPSPTVETAMEDIYSFLENTEECQFSLDELKSRIKGEYQIDSRTVKSRLLQKFGEDILIVDSSNKTTICFKNTGYKILTDNWYNTMKSSNREEERLRVVKAAADIILEDIRSQVYNTTEYPPTDNFLNDVETVIPQTLLTLLTTVITKNKKGSMEKWNKKCVALSHAVIAAARPRSFLSPLLTGLSIFMYKKFGSKLLIDLMSSLGFSSSYHEAQLLEVSTIMQPQQPLVKPNRDDAFCQLVFDNADFNVNTIDGRGTFHAMGGIICMTPYDAGGEGGKVKRSEKLTALQLVSSADSTELQTFVKNPGTGLKTVAIKDLDSLSPVATDVILPLATDILWLLNVHSSEVPMVGWNGFMEKATSEEHYQRSKVFYLPFINAPPSNLDTVYTALLIARQKCDSINQKTCFVTFDQPLYMKAQEIVHNGKPELKNVIPRLGGFHLLMSFLGAIGTIMAGSGLSELLTTIYAQNSIIKMMSGHAYSRAVRAHLLTHQALSHFIIQIMELTEEDKETVDRFLSDVQQCTVLQADNCDEFKPVATKFETALCNLQQRGPTAKLWVQYFKMVTLVKQYIQAERMGDFELHLNSVKKMLPFFHAAGHWFYAKTAHLYLQEMLCLKDKLDPAEFQKFTIEGHFTVRRSDKFWSGIWTDMTIEQMLMKDMKIGGGLIGRGMTESTLLKWTLGMTYLQNIAQEMEKYSNVTSTSSEQHVELRPARMSRDASDVRILREWLSKHPPFPETDLIININSGVVGSDQVNCHQAQVVGGAGIAKIVGNTFGEVSFKKKDKVITLMSDMNTMKVGDKKLSVDPLTLFNRMCIAKQSEEDLQDYLSYELAPFPMALFNEDGMRKGTKSLLYEAFSPLPQDFQLPQRSMVVIDGGYLLHKVVWNRSSTFEGICHDYVKYVQRHYGTNVMVIFDGYATDPSQQGTKTAERARRYKANSSADVVFDKTTVNTTPQDKFLANEGNKDRFMKLLSSAMQASSIVTDQASEDADRLIVATAKCLSPTYDAVIIVGEDIDLLVLLTGTTPAVNNVYLKKPARGKHPDAIYSSTSYKYNSKGCILLLHAISGCDTTSNIFGFGKNKLCQLFRKDPSLLEQAEKFSDPAASCQEISAAGEKILVSLYGGSREQSLNSLRYCKLKTSTTKLNLAKLPPTTDAAHFHFLRTYHQVMEWMGIVKDPIEWGWSRKAGRLEPIRMSRDAAPPNLLKTISCRCKTGCMAMCGCRKAGLNCSTLCKFCAGQECDNRNEVIVDEEDDADQVISLCYENEDPDSMNSPPTKRAKRL